MLDIKFIKENEKFVKENIKKKFQKEKLPLVDKVIELDEKWRKLKYDEDKLRSNRNKVSKEINELKKNSTQGRIPNTLKGTRGHENLSEAPKPFQEKVYKGQKDVKDLIKKAKEIPGKIGKIQVKRKKLEVEIKEILYKIPNIIHKSVPIGKDDSENVEVKKVGKPKVPNFKILNHVELAEKIRGVDFDSARDISGSGFYFLEGDLAILHSAVLSFARDYMISKGFKYVVPPFMIREKVVDGVMSFEEKDVMMYKIEGEDLYLIGTSEHSMIGRFINKTINIKNLPINLTSYSPCFRKEVGAHGLEEKGFYRVHQFEKQEMIAICEPEDSMKWYDKMLKCTVDVFRELEIPVRILECCSGDLADLKHKSADVEAWSPRQKKYWEAGSCSNLTDAQARRLNIKIENKGKRYFAHTLNNTVIASPRALIALIENNQQKDGSIKIPKVLWKYTGFRAISPKEKGTYSTAPPKRGRHKEIKVGKK